MTAGEPVGDALWDSVARARTLLYVPGNRPDRFEKAAASGADQLVLDLEDAVAPELKVQARQHVDRWLSRGRSGVVRINGVGTPWHDDDLAMLAGNPRAVILPKAAAAADIARVWSRLPAGSCIVPILETAAGILAAREVCSAPGVVRVIFGSMDLANDIGVDHTDRAALAVARALVVLASAASGVAPPIDGVTTWITDGKTVDQDVQDAAAVGFAGKSCAHPRQVPIVQAAFAPSPEQIRRATAVVAVAGNGSATVLDGQLIGKPVVEQARRMLAEAER